MEGLDAWPCTLAFWQPERSDATCAGVRAGACTYPLPFALRYSAEPRVARPCRREHGLSAHD